MPQTRYLEIERSLRGRIERGELRPGDRVPSENELARSFEVSRMTARRALEALASGGVLLRTKGLGSFVADARAQGSITRIRDIADEISERGHSHSMRVLGHGTTRPGAERAAQLGLDPGTDAFHSVVVHLENDVPIQHETRWVHPVHVPGYLDADLGAETPSAYLFSGWPLTDAEQTVEAVLPDADVAAALDVDPTSPCLRILRRTFARAGVISVSVLVHPGDRYRLGTHVHDHS
ncbi:MAG: UTRA domain-containing protein [Planctomycetota bacterium]